MAWNIDGTRFASQDQADRFAEQNGLVILEWFAEDGEFVADYEYLIDDL